jgi:hypothetical protein
MPSSFGGPPPGQMPPGFTGYAPPSQQQGPPGYSGRR